MQNTEEPIIIEQTFKTSLNNVWNAISDPEEMKIWFFKNIVSFKPEVGFETQFEVNVEDRKFTHLWKITEVIPFQKITYNWKYKEYPGDSLVTFELIDEISHVKLRVTHKVVKNFPSDIPEFKRENGIEGWNYFIKNNLIEYLEAM